MDSLPQMPVHRPPTLSFVLPCLNEEQSLDHVINTLDQHAKGIDVPHEIIVADNGSNDMSISITHMLMRKLSSVLLVSEPQQGYGAATMRGIERARGTYIVCLDADGTYTPKDAIACAHILMQNQNAFIIGNRLTSPDSKTSMPWSHRIIGTPAISALLRIFFNTTITDPNCGLRGFARKKFISLGCTTTGMEFASETIARATHANMQFIEFPISYAPRIGESKLRTLRDGFRHVYTIFATRLRLIGTPR